MATWAKPTKEQMVICPRCGRTQADMILNGGRLYTQNGHVPVIAYVCSGCEKLICWEKGAFPPAAQLHAGHRPTQSLSS